MRDAATLVALAGCAPARRAFAAPVASAGASGPRAWAGYDRATVVDGLGGPGGFVANAPDDAPLDASQLADVRASGITAVNLTVGPVGPGNDLLERTFRAIGGWEREIDVHPDLFVRVRTAADLRAAKASRRLGLIYGFQDTAMLGSDLGHVELFQRFGVRIIQLTYQKRNLIGDGCLEPGNAGLSSLGRELVNRLNAARIVVDLSHAGQRTISEGIAASTRPAVISHTGCAALNPVPRNVRDEELRALAERGGVAGLYLMPFLRASGQPHVEDLLRHLEHALQVCGEDHIGIGTDGSISATILSPEFVAAHHKFVAERRKLGIAAPGEDENVYTYVPELNGPMKMDLLAAALAKRGHPAARIEKILGGNFARVFREVWG